NADAAGWGWFTDASPGATPAAGRMDLLTVVEHELGHVLFGVQDGTGLMEATLAPGIRLFPASGPMAEAPAAPSMSGLGAKVPAASLGALNGFLRDSQTLGLSALPSSNAVLLAGEGDNLADMLLAEWSIAKADDDTIGDFATAGLDLWEGLLTAN